MKNNSDLQKIFEVLSPDREEIDRMEKRILSRAKPETARRLRFMPVLAAALIMVLGLTAAAAAAQHSSAISSRAKAWWRFRKARRFRRFT